MDKIELTRDDYTDPQCPFCTDQYAKEPPVRSIPVGRIISKLDELLSKNDYESAERTLSYWLTEAINGRDKRGELSVRNELMGLYRKLGKKELAIENAEKSLELIDELELTEYVSSGTIYLNCATVYKAFSMAEKAMPIFEKALGIYDANLKPDDTLYAGLYNNMALALTDLDRFAEAEMYYKKAIESLSALKNSEPEQAISYLNMADCAEREKGFENAEKEIQSYIEKAVELLDTPALPQDGNYAFVCEKCAPTFGYYGYFMYEKELKERARRIYERN